MSVIIDGTLGITSVTGSAATAVAGPAFSADDSATTATAATYTLIVFGTENFDTAGAWDGSKFLPTVAGYYQINATTSPSVLTNAGSCAVQIRKNGSSEVTGNGSYAASQTINPSVSTVLYLNGTTDYVEIYGRNVGNANLASSTVSGCLIRGV
jgi:hypothetical protein